MSLLDKLKKFDKGAKPETVAAEPKSTDNIGSTKRFTEAEASIANDYGKKAQISQDNFLEKENIIGENKSLLNRHKNDVFDDIEYELLGYNPHIEDIMSAYRLLFGKSIRKYRGKSTKRALYNGLRDMINKQKELSTKYEPIR